MKDHISGVRRAARIADPARRIVDDPILVSSVVIQEYLDQDALPAAPLFLYCGIQYTPITPTTRNPQKAP